MAVQLLSPPPPALSASSGGCLSETRLIYEKLAKASTLALISMMVILVTVVIQGLLAPAEDRGSFSTPLLTVNSGILQAIGVISFGEPVTLMCSLVSVCSLC